MTFGALAVSLLAAGVLGFGANRAGSPSNPTAFTCRPAQDPYSLTVLGVVRKTLSDERIAPVRAAMNLSRLSRDSVAVVLSDSLCLKAAETIAAYEKITTGKIQPVVVRIGLKLWAEDPSLSGGEFAKVYILNAEGTRVLGRY